ncbi:efflux RND transporter periplasmic adaptor subunit [Candidatus Electronema sp. PJ]|uniref:efflux RND transporter periplasmic adaptor subunit n=1 Tax=Candidatus Electronema sp. PJ TaxID=3401572 RepID=UPI003AA87E29
MNHPEPKTLRGKILWFFLNNLLGFLFILLLLGVALFLGEKIKAKKILLEEELKAASAGSVPAINVVTLKLQPITLRDKINLPGIVEPWTRLEVKAQVAGKIEEIFVQEGEQVKKGQLIARIEAKDYQITLDSAKANYALAQANLARNESLRSKGISTQANLEEQQNQLRQAKASLEQAELQLARCQITAPMAGVISRRDAEVGLLLNALAPTPVVEILALDRVKAVIAIPESDVAAVRKLSKVEVEIQALDQEKIMGSLHFLAPAPESQAQAYRLELALDNPKQRILPGMFVRANLIKTVQEQALAVPLYAVISRNNEQFVYVEEKGIAHKKAVKIGFMEGWQVLITSGLKAGDKIILEGHRSVEEGQAVKVVKAVADIKELLP